MTDWITAEWVSASGAVVAKGVQVPGLSATVEVVVKAKTKELARYHRSYKDGALVDSGLGAAPEEGVSFTLTPEDARALILGELDPSVAFMSGRLKTAGDNGLVLRVLEAWSSPQGRKTTEAIVAATKLS